MSSLLILTGAAGVICTLAALVGVGLVAAGRGQTGMALLSVAAMVVIIALTLIGVGYADMLWEGRS